MLSFIPLTHVGLRVFGLGFQPLPRPHVEDKADCRGGPRPDEPGSPRVLESQEFTSMFFFPVLCLCKFHWSLFPLIALPVHSPAFPHSLLSQCQYQKSESYYVLHVRWLYNLIRKKNLTNMVTPPPPHPSPSPHSP